jgi:biopolymer transport protein TolR
VAGGMQIETGGKGKKKPLDTAINLVPFIDLMAVTISFLIMTAVWNQIGRLQVSQSGGPSADTPPQEQKTLPLNLTVTERGFTLSSGGSQIDLPKKAGAYDFDGLLEQLKKIREGFPDQRAITVAAEDAIRYEDLVKVIDKCIGIGLPDISVTAAVG